jgi:signal peptidase I
MGKSAKTPATAAASDRTPPPKSTLREYLESIIVAFILALFIRTFIVQAFKIPTGSMETNLLIGDHLLVNKVVYSPSAGGWEQALLAKRPVHRGDVVVFKYPGDASRDFIKRVIALPGETVAVRGKAVYINGRWLHEDYTFFGGGTQVLPHKEPVEAPERFEDLPAVSWAHEFGTACSESCGPQVVPDGRILVMGDNRDNSSDGRVWGFLPLDQIKGRALLVYWSYEATRAEYNSDRTGPAWLKDLFAAVGKTRWNRFFHLIR